METRLTGPGRCYSVRLLVQAMVRDKQKQVELERGFTAEKRPDALEYCVTFEDLASLHLTAEPEGLRIHRLRLLAADMLVVIADVRAGPDAPEWLPRAARYLLFDGDREEAQRQIEHYQPFGRQEGWVDETIALDRLMAALGQSISRANGRLARQHGDGGAALVAALSLRVGISRVEVSDDQRVLLTLLRPGEEATQHLDLNMTTVPTTPETESRS